MILKYRTRYKMDVDNSFDKWNFISGLTEISVCPNPYGGIDVDMTADKNRVLCINDKAYLLDDSGNTIEKIHS